MPIDFVIAGMPKAGTTFLWSVLKDHPEVFLPALKEPGFFAFSEGEALPLEGPLDPHYWREVITERADYDALFAQAGSKFCGDASPIYSLAKSAPQTLAALMPQAKIILMLREPSARAFSQFAHHRRDGMEPAKCLSEALTHEAKGKRETWSLFHRYGATCSTRAVLERFDAAFPRQQIYCGFYEDLSHDPRAEIGGILRFLDLRDDVELAYEQRPNVSRGAYAGRSNGLRRMLNHGNTLTRFAKKAVPRVLRAGLKTRLETWNDGARIAPDPEGQNQIRRSLQSELPWLENRIGPLPQNWSQSP